MSDIRDVLAAHVHEALGLDNFGAANDDERDEMLTVADAIIGALPGLGYTPPQPPEQENFDDPAPGLPNPGNAGTHQWCRSYLGATTMPSTNPAPQHSTEQAMAEHTDIEKVVYDFIEGLRAERRLYPDLYAAELAVLVTAELAAPRYSAGGAVVRDEALAAGDSDWMDAAGPAHPSGAL